MKRFRNKYKIRQYGAVSFMGDPQNLEFATRESYSGSNRDGRESMTGDVTGNDSMSLSGLETEMSEVSYLEASSGWGQCVSTCDSGKDL